MIIHAEVRKRFKQRKRGKQRERHEEDLML